MLILSSIVHVYGKLLQECVAEDIDRKRRIVVGDENIL